MNRGSARQVDYGREVEPHVEQLTAILARKEAYADPARWYALKLLQGDAETAKRIPSLCPEGCENLFHPASSLFVILNSMRLVRGGTHEPPPGRP